MNTSTGDPAPRRERAVWLAPLLLAEPSTHRYDPHSEADAAAS